VACQLKKSSPTGPALQLAGGSLPKSCNSLLIRFNAMAVNVCGSEVDYACVSMGVAGKAQLRCGVESRPIETIKRGMERGGE